MQHIVVGIFVPHALALVVFGAREALVHEGLAEGQVADKLGGIGIGIGDSEP